MTALVSLDPAGLSRDERLYVVEAWARQAAWVAAQEAAALVDFTGPDTVEDEAVVQEDLRVALRLSARGIGDRIARSRALARLLPGTALNLERGRISWWHSAAIADAVLAARLGPEQTAVVEARVLDRAHGQTLAEFKRSVTRAVASVDPRDFAARHADAAGRRRVVRYPEPDGMATFSALLPAVDAATVWTALDALARAHPNQSLGIDARRGDALVQMACTTMADPGLPWTHGRPVQVNVTIDVATLLSLAEHPGELAGYGPIPSAVARSLAADATWRRMVTDPVTGHLLDYGTTTYTPPQVLRDYLLAAHPRCVAPGCAQPSQRADLDHVIAFGPGATSADNLRPQCRHHHLLKTKGRTRIVTRPGGAATWTTPTGRTHELAPTNHNPLAFQPPGRATPPSAGKGPPDAADQSLPDGPPDSG
jgi:hypothetical protein